MAVLFVFHRVMSIVQHVLFAEERGEERNEGKGKRDKAEPLVAEVVSLAHSRSGVDSFESSGVNVTGDGSDAERIQLGGLGKVVDQTIRPDGPRD